MSDVARAAGVSAATVSRALRGEPGVSEATRRYVTEVAKRMRYAIARDASSLAGGRRYAIAVLTGDVARGDLLAGAEGALRQAGYDVLLYGLRDAAARTRFFEDELLPLARRVDGVLALSVGLTGAEDAALAALDVPVVAVRADDPREALGLAARHLARLGHRDVALVLGEDVDEHHEAALVAEGLRVRPEWTLWSSPTVAAGEQVVEVLFDGEHLPTAVISASGEVALGALLRLRRDGRAVPGDVSVVSLEGVDLTRAMGITAVEGSWRERGEHAVRVLLATLRGEDAEHERPGARLVARDSSGPLV
ncbi:LacI family DNA-binding transcriptional regulator [Saccharothrix sp. Mg75]|uniref:LacI family DNA-binding transcriptional regulator n=1 Tax=Saccharothrix sp. Mg75 TaxID=3445357 RepID=UPI003EEA44B4